MYSSSAYSGHVHYTNWPQHVNAYIEVEHLHTNKKGRRLKMWLFKCNIAWFIQKICTSNELKPSTTNFNFQINHQSSNWWYSYLYKFLKIGEKITMGATRGIDLIWMIWSCESAKQGCAIWTRWMHNWVFQYQ
jgi:hypothetical protein